MVKIKENLIAKIANTIKPAVKTAKPAANRNEKPKNAAKTNGAKPKDKNNNAQHSKTPLADAAIKSAKGARQNNENATPIKKANKNDEKKLFFFAMGGMDHIGQNMYVYRYMGKYLIVDCGMGFMEEDVGAGDVKYCDTTWLEKHKKDVVGIIITHGHEDHIGALKYVWQKFKCPIYCTRFVHETLKRTFDGMELEYKAKDLNIIDHKGSTFELAPFSIENFHVSHSIPEAQMFIIKTPAGKVLHTGDWTFNDDNPIESTTDYARLREIGSDPKLLACVCDSTSSDRQTVQTTEKQVRDAFTEIMKKAPGRVFVTGYSRSIARIKMFAEAAKAAGRVPAIKERSNPNPVPYVGLPEFREIGTEFGYLDKGETLLHSDIKDLPAEKQAIFLTGSQGEKYAMLTRLCRGHVKELQLQATDTVIFSAIIIPGREADVSFLYNKLARMGVHVHTIYDTDHIHANGHAGRPEFERFYDMVHPQVSIPMHGEYITEMLNAKMAMERGGAKHMMIVHNGEIVALEDGAEPFICETFKTGFVVMEGETERSGDDDVYKTRKKIAISGAIFVTLPVDKKGFLKGVPEISSAGVFETDETGFMKRQIQIEITKAINDMSKTDRKDRQNLIKAVQMASNKIVRASLGDDKRPQYNVHFVLK